MIFVQSINSAVIVGYEVETFVAPAAEGSVLRPLTHSPRLKI